MSNILSFFLVRHIDDIKSSHSNYSTTTYPKYPSIPCIFLQTYYNSSLSNWFSSHLVCQDDKHTISTPYSCTCTTGLWIQSLVFLKESLNWYKYDFTEGSMHHSPYICQPTHKGNILCEPITKPMIASSSGGSPTSYPYTSTLVAYSYFYLSSSVPSIIMPLQRDQFSSCNLFTLVVCNIISTTSFSLVDINASDTG